MKMHLVVLCIVCSALLSAVITAMAVAGIVQLHPEPTPWVIRLMATHLHPPAAPARPPATAVMPASLVPRIALTPVAGEATASASAPTQVASPTTAAWSEALPSSLPAGEGDTVDTRAAATSATSSRGDDHRGEPMAEESAPAEEAPTPVADAVQVEPATPSVVYQNVYISYLGYNQPQVVEIAELRRAYQIDVDEGLVICFIARAAGVPVRDAMDVFVSGCHGSLHELLACYRLSPAIFFADLPPGTICPPAYARPYAWYGHDRGELIVFSNREYQDLLALKVSTDCLECPPPVFFAQLPEQVAPLHVIALRRPTQPPRGRLITGGAGSALRPGRPFEPSIPLRVVPEPSSASTALPHRSGGDAVDTRGHGSSTERTPVVERANTALVEPPEVVDHADDHHAAAPVGPVSGHGSGPMDRSPLAAPSSLSLEPPASHPDHASGHGLPYAGEHGSNTSIQPPHGLPPGNPIGGMTSRPDLTPGDPTVPPGSNVHANGGH